jgi:predicted permease
MPLFDVIAPVVLLVLTGFLLGRARPVEVRSLAPVSMYLFAPALVFQSLTGSSALSGDAPRLVAACVVHLVALLGFGFLLAAALGLRGKRRAAFLIPAFLYNAGNYGLPVSLFAFGQAGFHAATLVFVVNATVGNFLAGVTAAWGSRGEPARAVAETLRLPVVYAAAAALLVAAAGWSLPAWLDRTVAVLASGAIPLLVVTLGVQLAQTGGLSPSREVFVAALVRLLASPLLAAGLAGLVGLEGVGRDVFVLVAAMPAAVNAFLFAAEFDCEPGFVAAVVFTTTLASLLSVSGLLLWLR